MSDVNPRHDFSVTMKALFVTIMSKYTNNGHFFLLRIVIMAASTTELLWTRPFHAYKHACMHARARNRPSWLLYVGVTGRLRVFVFFCVRGQGGGDTAFVRGGGPE